MGAASSASAAAVVDAYSERELEELLEQLGQDCRSQLAAGLQASQLKSGASAANACSERDLEEALEHLGQDCRSKLATGLQASQLKSGAAAASACSERDLEEALEHLGQDCRSKLATGLQASQLKSGVAAVNACSESDLEEALEHLGQDCRSKLATGLQASPAQKEAEALPPKDAAEVKALCEEVPIEKAQKQAEAESEVTSTDMAYLREQLEALADPSSGHIQVGVLRRLFQKLGAGLGDEEFQVLVQASGPDGKTPTPEQFLDYVLEGVAVVGA